MKKILKWICICLAGNIALLGVMHTAEWFLVGKKVAEAAGIPKRKALPKCLLKGFLWWKPLKKELGLE